jgi:acetyl-CoA carboxylase biotin carboxyl carrier protein
MDVKDLKRLLESVRESGISELVLETGDYKLSVKRGGEVSYAPPAPAPHAPPPAVVAPAAAAPTTPADAPPAVAPTEAPSVAAEGGADHLVEVTAPIVGTFYAAPSPDAPPFVKVGDRVEAGAVLCIIEAMKLMNEIEAEVGGVVREILVRNEEPVEYGQVLFRLEPA